MMSGDTIAAISSAVGPAGRMIVRASGPGAADLLRPLGVPDALPAQSASRLALSFRGVRVPAWVYVFRAPRSYTGEDLVEFHLPGSPVLVQMLLEELYRLGTRPADPGEFTARAYFNGRMDLTRAEGVAATIAARGERELAAARQLLAGELARRLAPALDLIADTLALIEVGIDFSEEDVSFLASDEIAQRVARADDLLDRLLSESARFERLTHEPQVVLVGRPNAGKSTLLNTLAGHERAVVSPVAGTTRDALSATIALARGTIRLIDVAGIDQEENASADAPDAGSEIDRQMRRRAMEAAESADVLALVQSLSDFRPRLRMPREPDLIIRSMLDLAAVAPAESSPDEVCVSAITGAGIGHLKGRLDAICFGDRGGGDVLALNVRHVNAVREARAALHRAESVRSAGAEVLALELREALDHLGSVLGRVSPDDLLGRIFAGFCIGK